MLRKSVYPLYNSILHNVDENQYYKRYMWERSLDLTERHQVLVIGQGNGLENVSNKHAAFSAIELKQIGLTENQLSRSFVLENDKRWNMICKPASYELTLSF